MKEEDLLDGIASFSSESAFLTPVAMMTDCDESSTDVGSTFLLDAPPSVTSILPPFTTTKTFSPFVISFDEERGHVHSYRRRPSAAADDYFQAILLEDVENFGDTRTAAPSTDVILPNKTQAHTSSSSFSRDGAAVVTPPLSSPPPSPTVMPPPSSSSSSRTSAIVVQSTATTSSQTEVHLALPSSFVSTRSCPASTSTTCIIRSKEERPSLPAATATAKIQATKPPELPRRTSLPSPSASSTCSDGGSRSSVFTSLHHHPRRLRLLPHHTPTRSQPHHTPKNKATTAAAKTPAGNSTSCVAIINPCSPTTLLSSSSSSTTKLNITSPIATALQELEQEYCGSYASSSPRRRRHSCFRNSISSSTSSASSASSSWTDKLYHHHHHHLHHHHDDDDNVLAGEEMMAIPTAHSVQEDDINHHNDDDHHDHYDQEVEVYHDDAYYKTLKKSVEQMRRPLHHILSCHDAAVADKAKTVVLPSSTSSSSSSSVDQPTKDGQATPSTTPPTGTDPPTLVDFNSMYSSAPDMGLFWGWSLLFCISPTDPLIPALDLGPRYNTTIIGHHNKNKKKKNNKATSGNHRGGQQQERQGCSGAQSTNNKDNKTKGSKNNNSRDPSPTIFVCRKLCGFSVVSFQGNLHQTCSKKRVRLHAWRCPHAPPELRQQLLRKQPPQSNLMSTVRFCGMVWETSQDLLREARQEPLQEDHADGVCADNNVTTAASTVTTVTVAEPSKTPSPAPTNNKKRPIQGVTTSATCENTPPQKLRRSCRLNKT